MKNLITALFLGLVAIGCGNNNHDQDQNRQENTQTEEPAPVVTVPREEPPMDSTSVQINKEGVTVTNKDDKNNTDIRIGTDSGNIDIRNKK